MMASRLETGDRHGDLGSQRIRRDRRAIAFAVSWKPFVKSKTNAVITTTGAGSSLRAKRQVKGGDRVFGTHTAAATGGRGPTDAPTASPPPARPGLDLHDSESAVF